ncbi:MAG: D-Ala-D-Ala carboxypeptidase family metallohydrolase [Tannerellaceae bacterium]|nr:D-Ala-D-Ala carboxypeptidase family metallohydrolase [Tannerellaceae bacterium]
MKLSNHFKLEEFIRSDTAISRKITNEPGEKEIANLIQLCIRLLQPLREHMGEPLLINSGYRCPELNRAVGGVATSQHVTGEAADVRCSHPGKLLAALLELKLDFDQAILYPGFLHLSYRPGHNRKQVLYAKGTQP